MLGRTDEVRVRIEDRKKRVSEASTIEHVKAGATVQESS